MIICNGKVTFVEVKPEKHGNARLSDGQCKWYWKFHSEFCETIRYWIVGSLDEFEQAWYDDVPEYIDDRHRRRLQRYASST